MKNINDKLSVNKYIDLMQTATDFRFNVFDMMSALVYARPVYLQKENTEPELFHIIDKYKNSDMETQNRLLSYLQKCTEEK